MRLRNPRVSPRGPRILPLGRRPICISGNLSSVSNLSVVMLSVAKAHVSAKHVCLLCSVCSVWSSLTGTRCWLNCLTTDHHYYHYSKLIWIKPVVYWPKVSPKAYLTPGLREPHTATSRYLLSTIAHADDAREKPKRKASSTLHHAKRTLSSISYYI